MLRNFGTNMEKYWGKWRANLLLFKNNKLNIIKDCMLAKLKSVIGL